MGTWVISFGGLAVTYAAIGCLIIVIITRSVGRFPGWHILPFLFVTLTFVMLTQHPFPAPGTLSCPVKTATPQLLPLRIIPMMAELANQNAPWSAWIKSRIIAATVMNFFICFIIGLCLPASWITPKRAALFGAALTGMVEMTQLSGIWGIYPCAYRQFNVDDLMLNFAGVCVGAGVARRWRKISDQRNFAMF